MSSEIRRGTPLEKFSEPKLGADIIPAERYTSPDFMAREWDKMWTRTWLVAGPTSDVTEIGSHFTFEIGTESIVIVRSARDRIDAFYNVCQHRASEVVRRGSRGRTGAFVCPYHLWTYDLEGRVSRVPDRGDFPQGIPEGMRMPRVNCDVWGGFVFVNLDENAKPLHDYLGVIPDHLGPYDFENNYALTEDITFEWACNWKVGVDAFNEVYHVQGIHPELLDFTDDVDCPIDLLGLHSRFLFTILRQSPRWTDEKARAAGYRDRHDIPQSVREIMQSMGIDPDGFEGDMRHIRPVLIAKLRELGNLGGLDFENMNDDQLWIDVHYSIFPNITLNISSGHFWYFRHRPHETDPNRMYWDFQNYQRIPRNGERPPRPEHIDAVWGDGNEEKLHLALRQDGNAAPPLQRGMRSRGFKGLHLSHQERRIRHFHETLDTYLDT